MSSGAPTSAPAVASRRDLIALGQAGRTREFLAIAAPLLDRGSDDAGVRFLLAANLASLGLRTLAGEELDRLPDAVQRDPDLLRLREAIGRLPDDRVAAPSLRATMVGNLRALRARDPGLATRLGPAVSEWVESLPGRRCFRCPDGNLVRDLGGPGRSWARFVGDQRAIAARFALDTLGKAGQFSRPLTIEGLDPPWLFAASCETLARNALGYAPRVTLVQADELELLDGLSAADLRAHLVDPRVEVLAGPDASQRWLNSALERIDTVVLGAAVTLPTVGRRVGPPMQAQIAKVTAAQADEFDRLRRRVEARYEGRDVSWWRRRYAEAARGGEPLRVLVPISRYSTFVRHSAEDLAESLRRLGCRASVHTEPTSFDQWSTVGHLRAIDEHEPDLIVVINYFRGDAGLPYPANVPWACWLQDAMPHQMDERAWGDLDFVAGHLHREIAGRAGFPADRSFSFPVVASPRKFHSGPVSRELRRRFECEIAYVSHQSETPEAFHRRSVRELGDASLARLAEAIRPGVEREAADPMAPALLRRLASAVERGFAECRANHDRAIGARLLRHYALPLADRAIRHSTLALAREVCERRGWRMRIFGRGWEAVPGLAAFARGDVPHGEALRACYQSAAVHLHASVNTLVHQRVMECALSGGLPLCRLTHSAVADALNVARREAALELGPSFPGRSGWGLRMVAADHPALMGATALLQRLGLRARGRFDIPAERLTDLLNPRGPDAEGLRASWLLGDLAETTFRSGEELETLVARAIGTPAWRRERSDGIARRVLERCSADTLAARLLEMVAGSLAGEGSRAAA